jgi:hypothetical protein
MWWIYKMSDHRWGVNMWGEGVETVKGLKLQSLNPSVSQQLTIKNWEDLDMQYVLMYTNDPDATCVVFRAKYVTAEDIKAEGPVPAARVRKADGSVLFKGDASRQLPLVIDCLFQD